MTQEKDTDVAQEEQEKQSLMTFAEFLESTPPSTLINVSELSTYYNATNNVVIEPELQLHCSNEACNGTRFFRCTSSVKYILRENFTSFYMEYTCSNCKKTKKTFSLFAKATLEDDKSGECYKFGEHPIYGPPTPARLISLIGSERDTFLKGRRCENQSLGIGAFVYYRRVVENQKNKILDEIIKVSIKLNADEKFIDLLKAAKEETQFKKAVESVKDAIPQALLINGHNPLILLHSALSNGLHAQSDEHCLEMASSVRVVLAELSERLAQALKDEAELNNALSKLMKNKK